jgi:hypothetical protein
MKIRQFMLSTLVLGSFLLLFLYRKLSPAFGFSG